MDILLPQTPFARMVGQALRHEWFTLVDVGCGGGLDHAWRAFEPRLRVLGLDSDSQEIARLQAAEANPQVCYRAGLIQAGNWAEPSRSPWPRLAIAEWKARHATLPAYSGGEAPGASVEAAPAVTLTAAIAEAALERVEFLKMDVDGPDFGILQTLDQALDALGVLGIGAEVNFLGGGQDGENSFHNTDRWLRRHGFDLFDLSTRRYSMAALPGRTRLAYPAETHIGRLFQGDAVYFRDLCAPQNTDRAAAASAEQLLKLAALFSLFALPDCAAEVLTTFRARLEAGFDVAQGLNLLAAEAQPAGALPVPYDRYMRAYAADEPYFHLAAEALEPDAGTPVEALGQPVAHGQASFESQAPLTLRTQPGRWSYALEWPIHRAELPDGALLRLTAEVEATSGVVGVGLLNADRISLTGEQAVAAGGGRVRVQVQARADAVVALMIRNLAEDGSPSAARVTAMETLRA